MTQNLQNAKRGRPLPEDGENTGEAKGAEDKRENSKTPEPDYNSAIGTCGHGWRRARLRIKDSLGRPQTLPDGAEAFTRLGHGPQAIFFGLGPRPIDALQLAKEHGGKVWWLECPNFAAAMREHDRDWPGSLPPDWTRLEDTPDELSPECVSIFFYRQNTRLFPEFWGPKLARARADALKIVPTAASANSVLLPGSDSDLLHQELREALKHEGYTARELPATPDTAAISAMVRDEKPTFVLSVNMRGINSEIFYFLQACGIPVAIWMVDNPWHILSQTRLSWWREAHIFTTDPSFVPGLEAAGAKHAAFLPLGCWPEMWSKTGQTRGLKKIVFVGRSSFPDRQKFFSAAASDAPLKDMLARKKMLEPPLTDESASMPEGGPDSDESSRNRNFHWWMQKLGIAAPWPGHDVRRAGFMAENCSVEHRSSWLKACLPHGLTVFGDSGWEALLKNETSLPDLRPFVDYYRELPSIYASADYVLNVTSLLLPSGLTQRHFDVWAAGGLLLSDHNAGLNLFPPELVEAMAMKKPQELPIQLKRLEKNPGLRRDLINEFRKLILEKHTYRHRIREMNDALGLR